MQYTLSDISVNARRLLIDVDQPVFLAGHDDDRHFQIGVVLLRRSAFFAANRFASAEIASAATTTAALKAIGCGVCTEDLKERRDKGRVIP